MVSRVFCDLYREILVFDFSGLLVAEVVNLVLVKEVMLGAGDGGHVCVNRDCELIAVKSRCGALSGLVDVAEICPLGPMRRHGVGVEWFLLDVKLWVDCTFGSVFKWYSAGESSLMP